MEIGDPSIQSIYFSTTVLDMPLTHHSWKVEAVLVDHWSMISAPPNFQVWFAGCLDICIVLDRLGSIVARVFNPRHRGQCSVKVLRFCTSKPASRLILGYRQLAKDWKILIFFGTEHHCTTTVPNSEIHWVRAPSRRGSYWEIFSRRPKDFLRPESLGSR